MATAVFCIAKSELQAIDIVDGLKASGFSSGDVSVLFPDKGASRDFAHERKTKAPEGATAGASTGGVLGGALGWLAGIGALAIPGIGPFIAAGPIVAALAGAGAAGAVGGITGALIGYGVPEYEAKRYEGRIRSGGILLSVHADSAEWAKRASELLTQTGGQDISSASESKGDYANSARPQVRI